MPSNPELFDMGCMPNRNLGFPLMKVEWLFMTEFLRVVS